MLLVELSTLKGPATPESLLGNTIDWRIKACPIEPPPLTAEAMSARALVQFSSVLLDCWLYRVRAPCTMTRVEMKPAEVRMISKLEASCAALSEAVKDKRAERTFKTKAWFVTHVATEMTAMPKRAEARMRRASCSRIGMRILKRRIDWASLVRRIDVCVGVWDTRSAGL
jgi:hypothetical protein